MADRDFLLSDSGEMVIRNGDFATVESLTQEVGLLLLTNRGEIRNDVFCGCDLLRRTNSVISRSEFERVVKLQLERDGKSWTELKNGINIKLHG